MRLKRTERGFAYREFDDYYGKKCSLQKSSADKTAIWLGVDNTGPHMGLGPDGKPMPNQDVTNGRMHLTQAQVKKLIPHLIKFAETGKVS